MFLSSPNTLAFGALGAQRVSISNTVVTSLLDISSGLNGTFYLEYTGDSAALPTYTFANDQDTGMFSKSTTGNYLGLSTGGTERFSLTTSLASLSVSFESEGGYASISGETLIGGALNVGGVSSVAYSRFGTATATNALLTAADDPPSAGALGVDG